MAKGRVTGVTEPDTRPPLVAKGSGAIRVCMVSPRYAGGGAEYQMQRLADVLRSRGVEVTFLAHHVDMPKQQPHAVVKIGRTEREPRFGYLMDAHALTRALRNARPQVIYQRVGGGYTGVAAHYARASNSPLVWHIAHDSDVSPSRLEPARNPLRPWLEKRALLYGLRRADAIIAQTEHQAALLQSNYGRQADLVVPNFHPEPTEHVDKSGPLTVVWIANLRPWKQPEAFVRLASRLNDIPDASFVMIGHPASGSGDRHWSDALTKSMEATKNLRYLGKQSHREVNALLARAHVFVNTSTSEGFPNTFIESWMRAVPVVSLNVDPDGVFDRHEVGMHARTEAELERCVRALLNDSALRARMGDNARAYALRTHSLRNAERLAEFILSRAVH